MLAPAIMCNGRTVDILDPKPEDFSPEQIATHLSRIPRYLGATCRHYSVLEHSILGCELIRSTNMYLEKTPVVARAFLLHDAHEAVIGDMTEPLADAVPGFRDLLKPIKDRLDRAIEQRFEVDLSSPVTVACVKYVDRIMLQREWTDLMPTPWYGDDLLAEQGDNAPVAIQQHAPHATLSQMVGQFCHLLRVTDNV
jgi:uncharacterized protein